MSRKARRSGNLRAVRVHDVVLDESHWRFDGEDSIGTVLYNDMEALPVKDYNDEIKHLLPAKPLFFNMDYPVPNEIVFIIDAPALHYTDYGYHDEYYFPPIAMHKMPTNLFPNVVSDEGDPYQGTYFKENANIKPLRPYEGDVLLEGRFGNSLRFGSTTDNTKTFFPNYWSTAGNVGDPITILRNGQNPGTQSPDKDNPGLPFVHIIEDIQNDDSILALCSRQKLSNFTPASSHRKSYLYDVKEKTKRTREVSRPNNEIYENVEEDIDLNPASQLPPSESRSIHESTLNQSNNPTTDAVDFDIAPTGDKPIFPTDESLPTSETDLSDSDLNEVLGDINLAPAPLGLDNLAVSPFNSPGDTGDSLDDITIPGYDPNLPNGGGTLYDDDEDFNPDLNDDLDN